LLLPKSLASFSTEEEEVLILSCCGKKEKRVKSWNKAEELDRIVKLDNDSKAMEGALTQDCVFSLVNSHVTIFHFSLVVLGWFSKGLVHCQSSHACG
jgi:hypothetical protein